MPPVSDSRAWKVRFNSIRRSSPINSNGIKIEIKVITPNNGIRVSVALARSLRRFDIEFCMSL